MGFAQTEAVVALGACGGDATRAIEWLLAQQAKKQAEEADAAKIAAAKVKEAADRRDMMVQFQQQRPADEETARRCLQAAHWRLEPAIMKLEGELVDQLMSSCRGEHATGARHRLHASGWDVQLAIQGHREEEAQRQEEFRRRREADQAQKVVRFLREQRHSDEETARRCLESSGWELEPAMGLLQQERVRKYVLVCGGAEADAHEHLQKSGWDLEHAIDEHRKEERRRQEEQKQMIERFREQRSSDEEVHMTASFLAGLRSHTDAPCCRPRDAASRRQTGTRGAHWHCWRRSE